MDLSLDEIIKKKGIGQRTVRRGFVGKMPPRPAAGVRSMETNARIMDARNKIIQRNRAKIRDAREKLAQITKASGDARLRLQKKRKDVGPKPGLGGGFHTRKYKPKMKLPPKLPQLISVPHGYIDYDNMEMEEEYQPANMNLRRTVHNDMLPPFSSYKHLDRGMGPAPMWGNDPFDCYEIPISRPPDVPEPINIRRQIRNLSPDILPPKGILREDSPPFARRYIPDQTSHLSYEMRTRLERAPDPHASMGIFANSSLKPPGPGGSSGYRIVVSNLHNSVTQSDIKELFEDIGELHEARLVRPGVAEVIFKSLKDAEKAVDTYHNRQLDGQPMKCLLVNPRASNKPTAPAIKAANQHTSSRSTSKTPLEIDIDALHKVLFRRH